MFQITELDPQLAKINISQMIFFVQITLANPLYFASLECLK